MARSRAWCFTLNNYCDADIDMFNATECRYLVYGREVADSGTRHLQGYVEYEHPRRMEGLKKLHEKVHWEPRKGTPEQAAIYCKKDGDFVERGEISKQGRRRDLEEVAEQVRDGAPLEQIAAEHPGTFVRYHRGLEALQGTLLKARKEKPKVAWLWGRTGSGKTREACSVGSFYMKDGTKWWNGYTQQQRIVIDDFDGAWPLRDFLRLLDRYPYQGQTKGGYVQISSPEIFITCEFPPTHWWIHTELEQIMRRLSSVAQKTGTEVTGNTMPSLQE